jgi:hypothetical protein
MMAMGSTRPMSAPGAGTIPATETPGAEVAPEANKKRGKRKDKMNTEKESGPGETSVLTVEHVSVFIPKENMEVFRAAVYRQFHCLPPTTMGEALVQATGWTPVIENNQLVDLCPPSSLTLTREQVEALAFLAEYVQQNSAVLLADASGQYWRYVLNEYGSHRAIWKLI